MSMSIMSTVTVGIDAGSEVASSSSSSSSSSPSSSSSLSSSSPLSSLSPTPTFTLFPALPLEIRQLIWRAALPDPRIVQVTYATHHERYISSHPPPVILHVNRESRIEARMVYLPLRLGRHDNPAVYIDFARDTVYLQGLALLRHSHLQPLVFELATSAHRHLLRRLAVDLRAWNDLCEYGWTGLLCGLRELVEVTMVIEFGRDFKGEIGFLPVPEWRRDLLYIEDSARAALVEQGRRMHSKTWTPPVVRCVILTRGGEQA